MLDAPSFTVIALVAILLSLTMYKAIRIGQETDLPLLRSNYLAQIWARDNTATDAVFITYWTPWRTVSLRRTVNPAVAVLYVYTGDQRAKQFDDDILTFYGLDHAREKLSFEELFAAENAAYAGLNEAGILRLSRQFGGDYIVRSVTEPLNFPEAYRNDQLVIYRLNASR
jgi:hypothetical protein